MMSPLSSDSQPVDCDTLFYFGTVCLRELRSFIVGPWRVLAALSLRRDYVHWLLGPISLS